MGTCLNLQRATDSGSRRIAPIRRGRRGGVVVVAGKSSASTATSRVGLRRLRRRRRTLAIAPALFDRVQRSVDLGYTDADIAAGRRAERHRRESTTRLLDGAPPRGMRLSAAERWESSATAGAAT